ncbi:pyridoxamine 5'-phosphate oxidase family protein [Nakamurella silvestris]|nr:pyridoxamine 5'-phosphate oxidase family protein [Nakamurella silvestris]
MAERQVVDREALHRILDEGLVAHVGLIRQGPEGAYPVVIAMGYARDGESILLHGSSGGGMTREAAAGRPVSVAVTHLDGLVFARTLFDSSMNYRSVVVLGVASVVPDAEKAAALDLIGEHLMPGRVAEVRAMTKKEMAATMVLRIPLDEVSVKVRAYGASEEEGDGESREVWAGVLPLAVHPGTPQTSALTPAGVPVPASVLALASADRNS